MDHRRFSYYRYHRRQPRLLAKLVYDRYAHSCWISFSSASSRVRSVSWHSTFGDEMTALTKLIIAFLLLAVSSYAQAAHSATLTWPWAQGTGDPATGFHVERSTTAGGPYVIVGTVNNPTTMTFTDLTVVGGQKYFYVITAFNAAGDSVFSTEVSGTIPLSAPSAPGAPTLTVK